MSNDNSERFYPTAEKLSKNPLGIIALFIVLVYALGTSTLIFSSIPYELQKILVLFLVIFPVLVLIIFYLLVTKHHDKLYSPSDYKDEKHFMETRFPVTGELRTSPKTVGKKSTSYKNIRNGIKEVSNTLKSLEEKVTTSRSPQAQKEVSGLVEKAQGIIDDVKTKLDWSSCEVRINQLLPNYTEIRNILIKNSIPVSTPFGTDEEEFGKPELLLLTFTSKAKMSHIKEILKIFIENKIQVDAINYSYETDIDGNTGIYIGSYTYQNEPYISDGQELINLINNDNFTKKEFIEYIHKNASNKDSHKTHG